MDFVITRIATEANPVLDDLHLEDGQIHLTQTKAEAVSQHLLIRFRFILGEWFLNLLDGIPYFTDVLGKNSPQKIDAIFRGVAVSTPNVLSIVSFTSSVNKKTRKYFGRIVVLLDSGEEVGVSFNNDFLK